MRSDIRAVGPAVVPLLAGMVDRELARLAAAEEDATGLRLRVLFRMLDQAMPHLTSDGLDGSRHGSGAASPN